MLIITRRPNEKIMVGDEIEIGILEIKGRQVRIGIQAPSNIPVYREEVYRRIQKEKENLK